MKSFFFIAFILLFQIPSTGQETERDEVEVKIIQLLSDGEEIDPELLENLIQLYNNPLDLNKADEEDLQSLLILTPAQIQHLLNYRKESGDFISLYELQVIPGFDRMTIEKILPFVQINSHQESVSSFLKDFFHNKNKYLLMRYEKRAGSTKLPEYAGDSHKTLLSFRNTKSQNFSAGIMMEKDAGESLSWSPAQRYFGTDYHSLHFALFNRKKIRSFIIGDYHLQFGQGLVLGTGFSPGKGGETILTVKKINRGISPHFSSMEYGFRRGAALTFKTGPAEITGFFSSQNIDGSIQPDNSFNRVYNGYHRTENELSKRKTIQENCFGGNISAKPFSSLRIGVSGVYTEFEKPVATNEELYRFYNFKGRSNLTTGSDFSFHWRNFNFFGEHAFSSNKKTGTIFGLIVSLSPALDLSSIVRNYEKDFHSFYSNGFSEGGNTQNEKGVYWGIKYKPRKELELSAYADYFRFPWLKYQISAPSQGQEYFLKASYHISRSTDLSIQARSEQKEKDTSEDEFLKTPKPVIRKTLSFITETRCGNLTFRSRVMYNQYSYSSSSYTGFTIIQDLDISLRKLTVSTRLALFDSQDFNSRLYVYERDVLYSFSIPFYYGNGMRNYLFIRYKVVKDLDIWVKVSGTHFFNQAEDRTDIRIQTRYKF